LNEEGDATLFSSPSSVLTGDAFGKPFYSDHIKFAVGSVSLTSLSCFFTFERKRDSDDDEDSGLDE
jgi:uncharacterized membrane protein YdcZ (DUF606 family)